MKKKHMLAAAVIACSAVAGTLVYQIIATGNIPEDEGRDSLGRAPVTVEIYYLSESAETLLTREVTLQPTQHTSVLELEIAEWLKTVGAPPAVELRNARYHQVGELKRTVVDNSASLSFSSDPDGETIVTVDFTRDFADFINESENSDLLVQSFANTVLYTFFKNAKLNITVNKRQYASDLYFVE